MSTRLEKSVAEFRERFGGNIATSADADYDTLRAVWNGAIDRRPALIVCCTEAEHVAQAIMFARAEQLSIAVRGGGHSYAGNGVCDGGMMIHLGQMNRVTVDTASNTAVCGGGATWADLDAATQAHGLAVTGGFISHTGVGGLTLGGGIGWLTKSAGLSCDNMLSVQIVTAEGKIIRASKDDNPDLYWAVRGGGGNFGVVTSFEFSLQSAGPIVHLGLFFYTLDQGSQALGIARDNIPALPADVTGFLAVCMSAPPEPFVPETFRGQTGHALLVVGFGSAQQHAEALIPIRRALTPAFELVTPIPYVALQQMFNSGAQWGSLAYEKALYLEQLSDEAIEIIGRFASKKTSPFSFCPTFYLCGAYQARAEDETAFGGRRSPKYVFNISAAALDRAAYEADYTWVHEFWSALRPLALDDGSYVNFIADAGSDRVSASYGEAKYQRLARIKARFDPENLFQLNANIKPH